MLCGLLVEWVGILAEPLHGRNAWRLQRLVVGIILVQGRRNSVSVHHFALTEQRRTTGHRIQTQPGARLARFAGAFRVGHPHGADNELIDADLAREYGDNHEPSRCSSTPRGSSVTSTLRMRDTTSLPASCCRRVAC